MLRDWFQLKRNSVWPEAKVNACLRNLSLVSEKQSALDSRICLDQLTQERSQASQPFNAFKQQLISSISSQRQSSIVLMANAAPPSVSVPPKRPPTSVSTARNIVFHYMDARPEYKEASLRGLQQSGLSDRPRFPPRVKPRTGPPRTPVKGDLRAHLTKRQQQMSQA